MPLQNWTRLIAAAAFSLAAFGSFAPAVAEEKDPVDPRVARIAQAALLHIAAAKGITFEAEIVNEVPLDTGQRIQHIGHLGKNKNYSFDGQRDWLCWPQLTVCQRSDR